MGFAIPILLTAAAIIFGLVVYDITRTDLQVWVWVVIQVIAVNPTPLGGGVYFLGLEKVFTYLEVRSKPELYS